MQDMLDPEEKGKHADQAVGLIAPQVFLGGNPGHGMGQKDPEPGCFPGDTKILTPTGERRIDEVRAADTVLSWSIDGGRLVAGSIKSVKVHGVSPLVRVDLANGTFLRATQNHTVRTTARWKRIDCLAKGDRVVFANGTSERVEGVRRTGEKARVFNLITNGERNFVANGVVVHNFTTLPKTRTVLHKAMSAILRVGSAEFIRSKVRMAYICFCSGLFSRNRSSAL